MNFSKTSLENRFHIFRLISSITSCKGCSPFDFKSSLCCKISTKISSLSIFIPVRFSFLSFLQFKIMFFTDSEVMFTHHSALNFSRFGQLGIRFSILQLHSSNTIFLSFGHCALNKVSKSSSSNSSFFLMTKFSRDSLCLQSAKSNDLSAFCAKYT